MIMISVFNEQRNLLKEARVHGSPLLPLANYDNYRRFDHFSRYSMDIHWHDEMELFWLQEGCALFRLNDEQIKLVNGDCVIVQPGAIHAAESIQGRPFCFEAIVFHPSMLQAAISDQCTIEYINSTIAGSSSYKNPVNRQGNNDYLSDFRTIISLNEERPAGYQLGIKGVLFQVLYHLHQDSLVQNIASNPRTQALLDRIKPVLSYIRDHYNEKLTEDRLAEIASLSKYHFIRTFKKVTGRTPIDYINYFRILTAQRLLEQTDDKILTIALAVGFNDLSYFYRVFEKYNGKPPGAYRQ